MSDKLFARQWKEERHSQYLIRCVLTEIIWQANPISLLGGTLTYNQWGLKLI